jgi:hypothetical protein
MGAWRIVFAAAIVAFGSLVAAAPLPAPLQPPPAVAPARDPLPIAQRHLRKAKEYLAASCDLLKKGDRHAIDGFYVACEEAWNAVWVCPGDPAILCEAAELYADGLAGFLESACQGLADRGRAGEVDRVAGPAERFANHEASPAGRLRAAGRRSHRRSISR